MSRVCQAAGFVLAYGFPCSTSSFLPFLITLATPSSDKMGHKVVAIGTEELLQLGSKSPMLSSDLATSLDCAHRECLFDTLIRASAGNANGLV